MENISKKIKDPVTALGNLGFHLDLDAVKLVKEARDFNISPLKYKQ
jgi:hypothetical protein